MGCHRSMSWVWIAVLALPFFVTFGGCSTPNDAPREVEDEEAAASVPLNDAPREVEDEEAAASLPLNDAPREVQDEEAAASLPLNDVPREVEDEEAAASPAILRLEQSSLSAHSMQMAGKRRWTFVATLKATPLDDASVPASIREVWAFACYVSGAAHQEEVLRLMRNVTWKAPPANQTLTAYATSTELDGKPFRCGVQLLAEERSSRTGGSAAQKGPLAYAMLIAPGDEQAPWKPGDGFEVSFPVLGYVMTLSETHFPDEENGVLAVRLCGFERTGAAGQQLVMLSDPIVVTLEPATLRSRDP